VPAGPIGSVWAAGSWSDTAWEAFTWADASVATLAFVLDLNTRIAVYLRDLYSAPGADVSTLICRYLAAQTGEYTARFQKLIQDATDAMT
jgi:hypothetical protein